MALAGSSAIDWIRLSEAAMASAQPEASGSARITTGDPAAVPLSNGSISPIDPVAPNAA